MSTKRASTHDRIIAAATRLLDIGGPDAVTLRAVAQHVGVSHNAPYRHFSDKRALLAQVARMAFEELGTAFNECVQSSCTPFAALQKVIKRYIAFGRAHPERYRLLFSDPEISGQGGDLESEALRTFDSVARLVAAAQAAGEIRSGDPSRITALLYAAVHGLVDLSLTGRANASKGMEPIEDIADLALELLKQLD